MASFFSEASISAINFTVITAPCTRGDLDLEWFFHNFDADNTSPQQKKTNYSRNIPWQMTNGAVGEPSRESLYRGYSVAAPPGGGSTSKPHQQWGSTLLCRREHHEVHFERNSLWIFLHSFRWLWWNVLKTVRIGWKRGFRWSEMGPKLSAWCVIGPKLAEWGVIWPSSVMRNLLF